MNRIKSILTLFALTLTAGLFAEEKTTSSQSQNKPQGKKHPTKHIYIKAETGASIPTKMKVSAPFPGWDLAVQGYDAGIGARPFIGGGIGIEFCPLFSSDFMLAYRPQFKYRKFQTPPLDGPASVGSLGVKTRKFDLDVSSAMLNVYLNGRGIPTLHWKMDHSGVLYPVFGGGVGVAQMKIFNFRSTGLPAVNPEVDNSFSFASENQYTIRYRFAYQVMAGLEFRRYNWAVGTGYRYFHVNQFKGPEYIRDQFGTALDTGNDEWKIKFASNEVYVELKVFL